jgi:hypothetical protein
VLSRTTEQRAAVLERVFARRVGQLVDERLGDERVLRRAHGAPEADGNAEVFEDPVHLEVGKGVGQIGGDGHHRRIDAVRRQRPLPRDEQ